MDLYVVCKQRHNEKAIADSVWVIEKHAIQRVEEIKKDIKERRSYDEVWMQKGKAQDIACSSLNM